MNNDELVVLVDEEDKELGVMEKSKVHGRETPLHRGLSVFIFDKNGNVIVQQRALHKKTWPGVWSNSVCGHPLPGEAYIDAARREVREELGIEVQDLRKVSDYRYRYERNGVVENEICPVFMGTSTGSVKPDPSEVMDWKWMDFEDLKQVLAKDTAGVWSEWCKEEVGFVAMNI